MIPFDTRTSGPQCRLLYRLGCSQPLSHPFAKWPCKHMAWHVYIYIIIRISSCIYLYMHIWYMWYIYVASKAAWSSENDKGTGSPLPAANNRLWQSTAQNAQEKAEEAPAHCQVSTQLPGQCSAALQFCSNTRCRLAVAKDKPQVEYVEYPSWDEKRFLSQAPQHGSTWERSQLWYCGSLKSWSPKLGPGVTWFLEGDTTSWKLTNGSPGITLHAWFVIQNIRGPHTPSTGFCFPSFKMFKLSSCRWYSGKETPTHLTQLWPSDFLHVDLYTSSIIFGLRQNALRSPDGLTFEARSRLHCQVACRQSPALLPCYSCKMVDRGW